ncbi:hypothetical protein DV515_00004739 [Chloebia gouldiae]|uniref:small monomeric GTPase n=1 Tax=Chloebia gouldiae TaxID=44316 RepID=A0A3L8SQX8_CHLGU|nr:hypothetical protein DV515_00004739 [Chloebia gouldiae]
MFLEWVKSFVQMASVTDARFRQKDSSDQNFDYMFKLLIIGNSSVGKTSFLFRYADDTFTPAFVSTVGIDFKVKTVYRNDKRVKLQIWLQEGSPAASPRCVPGSALPPGSCEVAACSSAMVPQWGQTFCIGTELLLREKKFTELTLLT